MTNKPIGQGEDYVTAYLFLVVLFFGGLLVLWDNFYSKHHPVVCSKEVTVHEIVSLNGRDADIRLSNGELKNCQSSLHESR